MSGRHIGNTLVVPPKMAAKSLKKLPVNIIIRVSVDEKSGECSVGVDVKHHVQLILAFKQKTFSFQQRLILRDKFFY